MMRGISPVIATVMILAVTVAIAVAVIGWITGLWGSLTGGTEQLQIYPDSYINATTDTIYLHVRNTGSADATITRIDVEGLGQVTNPNVTVVRAGETVWIQGSLSGDAIAGSSYNVKIYTANGNVFPAIVKATK